MSNMIQANELRLGNWVQITDKLKSEIEEEGYIKNEFQITSSFNKDDDIQIYNPYEIIYEYFIAEQIEPIPITEDWLLRFGFEASSIHDNYKLGEIEISSSMRKITTNERYNFYLDGEIPESMKIRIQYIHQLQNLFFALTGTELTLTT